MDAAGDILSLWTPGRAGLILNTKVASYAADTKVTFRPNHSAAWRSTEPKRATQISTTDPVRQRDTGDSPWKYCWHRRRQGHTLCGRAARSRCKASAIL